MPALKKIGAAALAAFGWTSGGAGAVTATYLQVGGGGGGGSTTGGGGGAGGLLTGTTSLNPTLSYTVVVGSGGAGGASSNTGSNGSNSSITGLTQSLGGGGGGGEGSAYPPATGGSGGGGGWNTAGASGTSGQGNAGGTGGNGPTYYNGAGGGGAGAVGASSSGTVAAAGAGGVGVSSSISGTATFYAGGGGGGGDNFRSGTGGAGGNGGGGTGATTGVGSNGSANTGGGGGGACDSPAGLSGGQGGSGIVIISYAGAQQFGGGIVTSVGGNTIHTFLTSGTLSPLSSLSASYLIVAGGGGGGNYYGGGGGGGGLLSGSGVTIDTTSTYIVTVGAGGAGATSVGNGVQGTNSSFSIVATAAVGGGYGGGSSGGSAAGGNGGSGGGAGGITAASGGTATAGQGNNGGAGVSPGAGGGGGAGAVGQAGTLSVGGAGGIGATSSISGTSTYYAGGGGGSSAAQGAGGTGGGTAAGSGINGTANTGGGGGATVGASVSNGGSGIVIISYAGSTQQMAGGSVTITGGNVIHTFTSSGYLTPLTYYTNSLRFRSSASASLTRTPTVAGNRQTWTWSSWVKRGTLGTDQNIFNNFEDSPYTNEYAALAFATDNTLQFYARDSGLTTVGRMYTTQVFRDPASWYHIVIVVDTTNSTSTDRLRMYINGSRVTAFSATTYPSQNLNLGWNLARQAWIGAAGDGLYLDGYQSNINFIDGQALTANSFGTFNSYGVWQPINYGGSYGTNGFYLPFNAVTTSTYAAAYGGSNYIISPSANYNASGDFTFETWVYFTNNPNNNTTKFIFDHRSSAGAGGLTLVQEGTDNSWTAWNAGNIFAGNTIVAGRWYHMAVCRQSGVQRAFLNGILTNTTADATSYSTDQIAIGVRYSSTQQLPSGVYLSNYRFVVGTALYTSNFTPSVTPLTAVTNTKLLTFQNSTIIDNSGLSNTLTNTGSLTTNVQYPFSINVFNDQSPQGNNWAPSGISLANGSTYDSMTDVPTLTSATAANYAVGNPLSVGANTALTNGNLLGTLTGSGGWSATFENFTSGKWYYEATVTANSGNSMWIGWISAAYTKNDNGWPYATYVLMYAGTGNKGDNTAYGASYTTGDVIGVALDLDGGTITFYKNGVSQGVAFSSITASAQWRPLVSGGGTGTSIAVNYGQQPFRYTPPTNYIAINTYNL